MNAKILLALVLALPLASIGCSGSPDASTADETQSAADETQSAADELTMSPKAGIERAVEMFNGPKAALTRNVTKRLPAGALRAALESALVDATDRAKGESRDAEPNDSGVWAVYSSKSRKMTIGYAVWAIFDDGSAISAALIGVDTSGNRVLNKDDYAQNDQDQNP